MTLGLLACSKNSISTTQVPQLNPNLYTVETEPLKIDEEIQEEFQAELDELIERTGLVIADMDDEQISKIARYYGYFGQDGKAIQLYEEALQLEQFQGYLVLHHNLGRAYEKIKEWDLAAARYKHLIDRGSTDYEKDLEKLEERRSKYEEKTAQE